MKNVRLGEWSHHVHAKFVPLLTHDCVLVVAVLVVAILPFELINNYDLLFYLQFKKKEYNKQN